MRVICADPYAQYSPTFRGESVLPKTQRNRAVLFRTRFKMTWRSEIHISIKVDGEALKWRRQLFLLRYTVYHICHSEGNTLENAQASMVYLCEE